MQSIRYHEKARLYDLLRQVRQDRRECKDQQEACAPVWAWCEKHAAAVNALKNTRGDVRKVERLQQQRQYMPRTGILESITKQEEG